MSLESQILAGRGGGRLHERDGIIVGRSYSSKVASSTLLLTLVEDSLSDLYTF